MPDRRSQAFPTCFLRFGRRPPTGCARTVPVRRTYGGVAENGLPSEAMFHRQFGVSTFTDDWVPRAFLIVVGKSPQPRRILDRYICLRSLAENTMTGHSSRFPCSRVGNPGQKSECSGCGPCRTVEYHDGGPISLDAPRFVDETFDWSQERDSNCRIRKAYLASEPRRPALENGPK